MQPMLTAVMTEAMDQCFISMRFPDKHPFWIIKLIHYAAQLGGELEAFFWENIVFQVLEKDG